MLYKLFTLYLTLNLSILSDNFPALKQSFINRIIEDAARIEKHKTAFEILLEEWGTMHGMWGTERRLPTMGLLLEYLIDIEAFRAASYLSMDVLGGTLMFKFGYCDSRIL